MRATVSPPVSALEAPLQAEKTLKAFSAFWGDFTRLPVRAGSVDGEPSYAQELFRRGRVAEALRQLHLEQMAERLGMNEQQVVRLYGRPPLPPMPDCVVYLVGHSVAPADDEPVKIGCARKLRKRIENLQAGSIQPLILLAFLEGDRAVEREIHGRLEAWRIREDWFEMCDEIRSEFGLAA